MKYSVATVAALAAGVMATPQFTNSKFDVEEGKPFEITFSGCDDGCTIVLQNGPSTNLKNVQTLTSSADGSSFTFTPKDLSSDNYNFKIFPTGDETDANYSKQFQYEGTGSSSSSASASASESKTSAPTTMMTSTKSEESSSSSSASTDAETTTSESASATTSSADETSGGAETSAAPTAETSAPDSAAGAVRYSPIALIAGAAAAIAFLN